MSAAWRTRILCLAGRIILENGGETYRAEDTVIHMAHALGMTEVDVFGIPSGLFISYTDERGERETSVCRTFPRGTHLARVDLVNQISRQLSEGTLAPEEVMDALRAAERLGEDMARWYAPAVAFLTAAGFAVMFGGGPVDMALGGLCAAAAGVMLLLAALEQLADVREVFARLTGMAGIEEGYLNTLVKVLGVSYVAELAAQTCQDLGEGGLALKVGLVGKLCVFTLTAPMLLSLLEMILELTP